MEGLPVSYIGPKVDLAFEALGSHHGLRRHDVAWFEHVDDVALHRLRGVVAIAPFEFDDDDVWGPCDIARTLHPDATMVLIYSGGDRSSRMMAAHVARGSCHARALVYRPGGTCQSPDEVLDAIERSRQPSATVTMVGTEHDAVASERDLTDVMAHSERFARLLYASVTTEWNHHRHLAEKMNYGDGTVRNIMSDIAPMLGDVGVIHADPLWGISRFAQLTADYRDFIRVAGRCHCPFRLEEGTTTP